MKSTSTRTQGKIKRKRLASDKCSKSNLDRLDNDSSEPPLKKACQSRDKLIPGNSDSSRERHTLSQVVDALPASLSAISHETATLSSGVSLSSINTTSKVEMVTLAKKMQLVVGINAVTRLLEKGGLVAGLICSSSPSLLCQHLLPLAASRGVPFAAMSELSETVGQLLGIKRAMCLGLKVLYTLSLCTHNSSQMDTHCIKNTNTVI